MQLVPIRLSVPFFSNFRKPPSVRSPLTLLLHVRSSPHAISSTSGFKIDSLPKFNYLQLLIDLLGDRGMVCLHPTLPDCALLMV
ncbi:hypothetical protein L1987_74384 [Smallanthus sonchifolius]|uniref:Uncharacterized protein n=1 Tax=Smallanthus sonchifolius TaxID=185202 RepID=A0ACB9A3F2_9ASTR|nr:hypothetical protein L1987_74384 [Smallanthus sonchifolius]